jgi:hypothetical protein
MVDNHEKIKAQKEARKEAKVGVKEFWQQQMADTTGLRTKEKDAALASKVMPTDIE